MDRKGPEAFRERWQKIADQALKQCGRLASLEVEISDRDRQLCFSRSLFEGHRVIWCDETGTRREPILLAWLESQRSKNLSPLHVLIGPEGGWSDERARASQPRRRLQDSPP